MSKSKIHTTVLCPHQSAFSCIRVSLAYQAPKNETPSYVLCFDLNTRKILNTGLPLSANQIADIFCVNNKCFSYLYI